MKQIPSSLPESDPECLPLSQGRDEGNVLHCVALCCIVLQCVAACECLPLFQGRGEGSVLQCVAT